MERLACLPRKIQARLLFFSCPIPVYATTDCFHFAEMLAGHDTT